MHCRVPLSVQGEDYCLLSRKSVSVSRSVMSHSFATLWTIACQSPLSMGSSRQEYWSGLPFSPPGDLPDPMIESVSPALQVDSLLLSHLGSANPARVIGKRETISTIRQTTVQGQLQMTNDPGFRLREVMGWWCSGYCGMLPRCPAG